jgi:hypothetical protein
MSRYYSKRNKQKVWRETYGTPFIRRRAFRLAQITAITAQGATQLGMISASFGSAASKSAACAKAVVDFNRAVNGISLNDGFVVKNQST